MNDPEPFCCLMILLSLVLQDITRLAVKHIAYRIQRLKTNALHLARLEIREIDIAHSYSLSKLIEGYLAVGHHTVKSNYYRHKDPSLSYHVIIFLKIVAVRKDLGEDADHNAQDRNKDIEISYIDRIYPASDNYDKYFNT